MKTNVVRVPMTKEIGIDLKTTGQMVNSKTNMVYLCNPNNPTGVIMNPKELEVFCKETSKKSIVFVDEAYHEYVMDKQYRSMVSLVNEGYDVLISRTASKVHGLAGLRVGYAISTPKIIKRLNSYMNGSLNVVGLRGAIASYKDKRFQKFSIEKNNEGRTIVTDYLDKKGIEYLDSQTNFIFINTGIDIKKFQPAMEKHKVLVGRPFPPYTDWCRLSIAKPEEMESFNKGFNKELG
jgi:histidinol-phosphate aminotransferase